MASVELTVGIPAVLHREEEW